MPDEERDIVSMMPAYDCHKRVHALRIANIECVMEGFDIAKGILTFEGHYPTIEVTAAFLRRNPVRIGGYFVVYEDGYTSFSPAEAFEKGYTLVQ